MPSQKDFITLLSNKSQLLFIRLDEGQMYMDIDTIISALDPAVHLSTWYNPENYI